MTHNKMKVSVVIPAYNEEKSILKLIKDFSKSYVDEIIVVDNNSTDKTGKLAKKSGADITINTNKDEPNKTIISKLKNVDVVFEAVGINKTVEQAISIVRGGGKITIIGLLEDMMTLNIYEVIDKEIEIRGAYGYTSEDFQQAINLLATKKVSIKPFITHVLPLQDINKGFEILTGKKENVIKVVLKP